MLTSLPKYAQLVGIKTNIYLNPGNLPQTELSWADQVWRYTVLNKILGWLMAKNDQFQ